MSWHKLVPELLEPCAAESKDTAPDVGIGQKSMQLCSIDLGLLKVHNCNHSWPGSELHCCKGRKRRLYSTGGRQHQMHITSMQVMRDDDDDPTCAASWTPEAKLQSPARDQGVTSQHQRQLGWHQRLCLHQRRGRHQQHARSPDLICARRR